jgi:hypothetical protein
MHATLRYLNSLRKRAKLAPMAILPSLDHARDLPRFRTNALNPLHVLLGQTLHGKTAQWSLHFDGDHVMLSFALPTGKLYFDTVPDDVWAEWCNRWPSASAQLCIAGIHGMDTDTVFGLRSSKDGAWKHNTAHAIPFGLLD